MSYDIYAIMHALSEGLTWQTGRVNRVHVKTGYHKCVASRFGKLDYGSIHIFHMQKRYINEKKYTKYQKKKKKNINSLV